MGFDLGTGLNKFLGTELGELLAIDIVLVLIYIFKLIKRSHFIYAKLVGTAFLLYLHFRSA